ncbi:MAG: fructose-6-phosphate aldolase [Candidatus Hydrothermota bacterium]|uniref:Probable transaldolase n=1 Tax=candidate division WOR-3 bacterium TaxID=2052148 RepID=A0A7C1BD09_UNCW3|nr:MAG: fructose-6-phosphate aldolase [Candidatus Hydrothermae bacterium]HDM89729.1 fructose-6-phosphate aldolase [candidate division WOR-3 bacterium]
MKLFIDTAHIPDIEEIASWGIIEGATTNPTLLSREEGDPREILYRICEIVKGPVSAEVIALDADGMVKEARDLAAIHENIVIKIPFTVDGLKAVRRLADEGIKTNVTLVFTPLQALLAAKAGATFVSPFIGRLDDIASEGMRIVRDTMEIFMNYEVETELLVASVRHPMHVLEAAVAGADIATVPPKVLRQIVKHPLTDIGIERFLADWEKVKGGKAK